MKSILDGLSDVQFEFMILTMSFQNSMMQSRMLLKELLDDYTLTPSEFALIHFISYNQDLLVKELADLLDLSSSTVVIRLNSLEEKGYIIRQRDDNDRRKVSINLTSEGEQLIDKMTKKIGNPIIKIKEKFDVLTDEEKNQLETILKKINDEQFQSELEKKKLITQKLQKVLGFTPTFTYE